MASVRRTIRLGSSSREIEIDVEIERCCDSSFLRNVSDHSESFSTGERESKVETCAGSYYYRLPSDEIAVRLRSIVRRFFFDLTNKFRFVDEFIRKRSFDSIVLEHRSLQGITESKRTSKAFSSKKINERSLSQQHLSFNGLNSRDISTVIS